MRTERSRTAAIRGTNINYELEGEPAAGQPTLVLVHGFAASLRTWDRVASPLAQRHQLLRVDLKGFGLSGSPRDGRYSIPENVEIVRELIARLNLSRVVLIGHSYGGAVACVLASAAQPLVAGLVLIDSACYQQRLPFFVSSLRHPIIRGISPFIPATFRSRFVLERLFVDRARIDAEMVERYAFPMRIKGSSYGYAETALQILPESFAAVTATIQSIAVPTQIIWGEHDHAVSVAFAQRLHEDIAGSRLSVITGAGHMPHEERPAETLRAIVSFLDRLASST